MDTGKWTPTKVFVSVQAIHDENGETTPVMIRSRKGIFHIFSAKKIAEERRPRGPTLEIYRVKINGKETELYTENGRWFVKEKYYWGG